MSEENQGSGVPTVVKPQMGTIDNTMKSIEYRAQLIARNQKLDSGVAAAGMKGFTIGFVLTVLFVLILPMIIWQVL